MARSLPIRVLFFTGDLGAGGSEAHLEELLLKIDRERIGPEVLLLRAEPGPRIDRIAASGVRIHDLAISGGFKGLLRRLGGVHSKIKVLSPDIVHTYGYPCDVIAPVLTLPRRSMRVITSRRGKQWIPRRRFYYRCTNALVDRVVCVSEDTRDFAVAMEGLRPERTVVIPNGVEIDAYAPVTKEGGPIRIIGALGRIRKVKGIDLLLEAFTRLERHDIELRIAGPAETTWAHDLVAKYGRAPGIRFVGDVRDAPEFLRSLDLFILPSRSEGMSNALLEAMATGLPIVATKVGSNPEVLARGEAGILIEPKAASIADGILCLLDDPPRARALGAAARSRAEEHYQLSTMVDRYQSLYEELAGGWAR